MSGKKKTLTEKLKEAEKRAFDAEFDLKLLRGKDDRACEEFKQMAAALSNERTRARTQYMLGQQGTITLNAAHQALKMSAIYQTAMLNMMRLFPGVVLVCPSCGSAWRATANEAVTKSGPRLCSACLSTVHDPWLEKPSEYAQAK